MADAPNGHPSSAPAMLIAQIVQTADGNFRVIPATAPPLSRKDMTILLCQLAAGVANTIEESAIAQASAPRLVLPSSAPH